MSDFLSRVEAILSGVMNFNPKSRVERLLMKWVGSVGNVEDLETEDKSSIVAAINEVVESGGGGGGGDKQDKALIVTITQSGGLSNYSADKTNAEIYAAWQAGREVIAEFLKSKMRCVVADANDAVFTAIRGEETVIIRIKNDAVTFIDFDLQPKIIADTAGYYTRDTVEGALAEIGAKLAAYPSEVWEGGSYGS